MGERERKERRGNLGEGERKKGEGWRMSGKGRVPPFLPDSTVLATCPTDKDIRTILIKYPPQYLSPPGLTLDTKISVKTNHENDKPNVWHANIPPVNG